MIFPPILCIPLKYDPQVLLEAYMRIRIFHIRSISDIVIFLSLIISWNTYIF